MQWLSIAEPSHKAVRALSILTSTGVGMRNVWALMLGFASRVNCFLKDDKGCLPRNPQSTAHLRGCGIHWYFHQRPRARNWTVLVTPDLECSSSKGKFRPFAKPSLQCSSTVINAGIYMLDWARLAETQMDPNAVFALQTGKTRPN